MRSSLRSGHRNRGKACQGEESGTRDKVEMSSLDDGEDGDEFSQMWNERANWQRVFVVLF